MDKTDVAVVVYDTHAQAESRTKSLQHTGFDMKKISIIGKNYHTEENVIDYFNTGDRAKFFGKWVAFWGGLVCILFSSGFMLVPGAGHIVVLEPFAAMLYGGLQGSVLVGGANALVGDLSAIGFCVTKLR